MRERITFTQKAGLTLDPALIRITDTSLRGPDFEAAREDRLTVALDELPTELQSLLADSHELHLRWESPHHYEQTRPFFSRIPPGFHLFYTPSNEAGKHSARLCSVLGRAFGQLHCSTPIDSFIPLPTDRFSHSTAFQFYQLVGNLTSLIRYVKHDICPQVNSDCSERAERLASAVSLDISFDAISHALRITAVRPLGVQKLHVRGTSQHRTEVGILGEDRPSNPKPDELGLSGLLTVLGQDSAPSPTVFTIPARHRDAGSGFSARFLEPTGLHPTLQLAMESNKAPTEKAYCALHAYMTLPRPVFPDKYQLADHVFMSSKNLTALRYSSDDVDLEAPDYVLKGWGSSLLVELAPPRTDKAQSWTVEVPLHARYLSPNLLGHQSVDIPYPAVFWACTAEEGTKFSSNPFERANLGYDALFGQRTAFWHVQPRPPGANDPLVNTLKIPVLDLTKAGWVEAGTAAAVMLGLAWVAWKLLAVHLSPMHRGELATSKSKKTK